MVDHVSGRQRAIIADFGTASYIGASGPSTAHLLRSLTVPNPPDSSAACYAAPEFLRRLDADPSGNSSSIGSVVTELEKRMDVFSYSVTLLELLSREFVWDCSLGGLGELAGFIARGGHPLVPEAVARRLAGTEYEFLLPLMHAGWSYAPRDRPPFAFILTAFATKRFRARKT